MGCEQALLPTRLMFPVFNGMLAKTIAKKIQTTTYELSLLHLPVLAPPPSSVSGASWVGASLEKERTRARTRRRESTVLPLPLVASSVR